MARGGAGQEEGKQRGKQVLMEQERAKGVGPGRLREEPDPPKGGARPPGVELGLLGWSYVSWGGARSPGGGGAGPGFLWAGPGLERVKSGARSDLGVGSAIDCAEKENRKVPCLPAFSLSHGLVFMGLPLCFHHSLNHLAK